ALARTVHELRLAGVTSSSLAAHSLSAVVDIGRLLARIDERLAASQVDDRAALFNAAAAACRADLVRWARLPMVWLDVPLDSRAEQAFAAALVERSPSAIATIPEGDDFAARAVTALGATI